VSGGNALGGGKKKGSYGGTRGGSCLSTQAGVAARSRTGKGEEKSADWGVERET